MRKLSELLPIVRQHLLSTDRLGDQYICYAVTTAYIKSQLTAEEDRMLRQAVHARMDDQNPDGAPNVMLVDCLIELGVIERLTPARKVINPEYWPHRDKWLDEWQAKLEGEGL